MVLCPHKKCGGLVKPDIVFFGEGLPARFFQNISVSPLFSHIWWMIDRYTGLRDILIL